MLGRNFDWETKLTWEQVAFHFLPKAWTVWCHFPLKYFLLVTELGLLVVDENKALVLSTFPFTLEQRVKHFLDASSGVLSEEEVTWTKSIVGKDDQLYCEPQLVGSLSNSGLKADLTMTCLVAVISNRFVRVGSNRSVLSGISGFLRPI